MKSKIDLNQQVRNLASSNGADHFGIADLSPAHKAILEQGGSFIAGFAFSISIGISLLDQIVDLLPHRNEKAVRLNYRHNAYDIINLRLDLAASIISGYLQQCGFRAFPIPSSKHPEDERISASFSHKLGAGLAGLGWIGKSCLLITQEWGPRIRWATILTDAPLETTGRMQPQRCGDCRKCADICPVHAIKGRAFRPEEPREARFDARKCDLYFDSMKEKNEIPVCGLCLYVCPYGRKNVWKNHTDK